MKVIVEWKKTKIFVYHDVKSITYRLDGYPALKKRDSTIDLTEDYVVMAIVD